MLKEKTKAPDFKLLDTEENEISLSDFLGKKVVLYFYPKDNTPGWTKQACVFAGVYDIFEEKNVIVIGVSKDSVKSHKKFKEKNKLPFILLSDKDGEVVKAYDVWNEKKIFGKSSLVKKIDKFNDINLCLSTEEKHKIYKYFEKDIINLERLINQDLSHWKY